MKYEIGEPSEESISYEDRIFDRFWEIMADRGINLSELARKANYCEDALAGAIHGKNQIPYAVLLYFYNYSLDWLFRGVGEMRIQEVEITNTPAKNETFKGENDENNFATVVTSESFKAACKYHPQAIITNCLSSFSPQEQGETLQSAANVLAKDYMSKYNEFTYGFKRRFELDKDGFHIED